MRRIDLKRADFQHGYTFSQKRMYQNASAKKISVTAINTRSSTVQILRVFP
jgi:hypothetical protein